jgi:hypothetical protein
MCAPKRGAGAPYWGCDREGVRKNAIPPMRFTSRCRVASPQAGPLLRRTRAHLVPVRALPEADFADFQTDVAVHTLGYDYAFLQARLSHEPTGRDTSD